MEKNIFSVISLRFDYFIFPKFIFSHQPDHIKFPKWPSTEVSYKWYKATYQLNALIHISTLFLICQQFVKTWTWQKLFSGPQYVTRLTVRWKLYLKVLTSWKRSLPAWKNFQTNVSKKGNLEKVICRILYMLEIISYLLQWIKCINLMLNIIKASGVEWNRINGVIYSAIFIAFRKAFTVIRFWK